MRAADWVARGREAILELLDEQHAAVWLEVEAKIADRPWKSQPKPIQPHHLSTARQDLRRRKVISETPDTTKGGESVPVLHLTDQHRRKKAFERAAKRKRVLQTRYLRWAVRLGLLGPVGEKVTHASLIDVAPTVGYRVERPMGGNVAELFGQSVPGGPLDAAAHLQLTDGRAVGIGVAAIPIEVKNVREWIYPDSERLHQLLYKAGRLQQQNPGVPIVPVLVCRRGAYETFKMAKAFGFYVADAKAQFVPKREDVTPTHVQELRAELGFEDLVQGDGPDKLIRHHFGRSLPRIAASAAANWSIYGPQFVEHFEKLRQPRISRGERASVAGELESAARQILAAAAAQDEDEEPEQPEFGPIEYGDYDY